MFEKEIKFIADFNLNKVKSFGAFITFERLLGSDIHPAVIQYISAELDYLISEDRMRLLQESVFDYSGPETVKYFSLIAKDIKKSKEISFEDLKKLVIQAVSFNLNYLARPNWSLSKLIYNDDQNRSIEEIKLNLSYIYFYDYIKSIFLSYISKRKITTLSITEFELILNKIDSELFATQPQKLVDYSLYSIAEFFNLGDVSKTKVPVLTLELFLKEKNLMDYLFRLRRAIPEDASQKYDVEDIKNIIYSSAPIDVQPVKREIEIPIEGKIPEKEEAPEREEIQDEEELQSNEEILPEAEIDIPLPFPVEPEILLPEIKTEEINFPEENTEVQTEEKIIDDIVEQKTTNDITVLTNDENESEEVIKEEISEQTVDEEIPDLKIEEEIEEKIEQKTAADIKEPVKEEIPEQTVEEEIPDLKIEDKIEEKPEEETTAGIKEPVKEEVIADEVRKDEKVPEIIEAEKQSIADEIELPKEEVKNKEISIDSIDSLVDEDFLSLFNDEVKKIEEEDSDLKRETVEPIDELKAGTVEKNDVDSFFDFEEETENLLRAFKETEDEMNSKGIDLFQDTSSATEKAAMDLLNDFHSDGEKKENAEQSGEENNKSKQPKKNGKYKEKRVKTILDSMSNNDVEKIIFNVFNDDKEDFVITIKKLNECTNYDEATEILKSVFVTYRVNPYTKDALTLTNSVANYFTQD